MSNKSDPISQAGIGIELHVEDFKAVKDFYKQLGFQIVWETPAEEKKGYLVMELEGNLISFWCGTDSVHEHSYFKDFADSKNGKGVELIIQVEDLDGFYEQCQKEIPDNILSQIKLKPWGLRDFRIKDCNGFYLRITENFDPKIKKIV